MWDKIKWGVLFTGLVIIITTGLILNDNCIMNGIGYTVGTSLFFFGVMGLYCYVVEYGIHSHKRY